MKRSRTLDLWYDAVAVMWAFALVGSTIVWLGGMT